MEMKLNDQVWMRDFDHLVATSGLDSSCIEEMRDALCSEWLTLNLDEVADDEISRRLGEFASGLVKRYLASAKKSSQMVANLKLAGKSSLPAEFPVADIASLPTVDDPIDRLNGLMAELRKHGDYNSIRDEYCRLSIVLNLHGRLAPAFRPALVTGKKYGDSVFKAIHRDQLVIDCHWLHATNQFIKVRAKDIEFAAMFRIAKPFPFDLAWQFAGKVWKADHRVIDMLRLTEFQQCQLAALRSDAVKKRVEGIEKGARKGGRFIPAPVAIFEQGLNAWCERDRRISKHREGYAAVWKARSFLGDTASVRQIGELAAMMLGESPKDDKTIRSREKKISRHILGD